MAFVVYAFCVLVTLAVAFYTFNFGRWAWGKGYKRGGIGVWVLAGLTVVVPLTLLFFLPR